MKPGIYFGLPEELYHADEALGSNDLKLVRRSPSQFWLRSKFNPNRRVYDKSTPSKSLGRAMHKIVLEGREDFLRAYVRGREEDDSMTSAQKSAITKELKKNLREDQTLLKADEFDLCMDAAKQVTSHPDLVDALTGGASEVSVFWTGPGGVPLKARFDRLKPGGIGDLKSIANERDDKLETAAKFAIKRYRYYAQAAHYLEGLAQFPALLDSNAVYRWAAPLLKETAADPSQLILVKDCVARLKSDTPPGFQVIFVQTSGAPDTWACTLFPGNPILDIGRHQVMQGICNYLDNIEKHGTNPWPPTWRLEELDMNEMPGGEFGWD